MTNRITKTLLLSLAILTVLFVMQQCITVKYGMSGASISPEAKTVSVKYFQNNAPLVNPQLSQLLTEELKDKFQSQTNLSLVNGIGDLHFEGEIIDYSTKPMAIKENDIAAENRLTITVRVKYVNSKDPNSTFDFDKTFTRFEDYSSTYDLTQVETELSETIAEQLVQDIFNESVVNW